VPPVRDPPEPMPPAPVRDPPSTPPSAVFTRWRRRPPLR
jgi:hypothetical protein